MKEGREGRREGREGGKERKTFTDFEKKLCSSKRKGGGKG